MHARLRAWLELFRVPNLLTVPGDPIAGFLLALVWTGGASTAWWRLAPAAGIALALYAFGLVHNDMSDFVEDLRQRPGRPLPSRRISVRAAGMAAFALLLLTLVLSRLIRAETTPVIVALVVLILVYNGGLKRLPVVGPLNMGLCRAASLLIGATAASGFQAFTSPLVLAGAATTWLYIALVTQVARTETKPTGNRLALFALPLSPLIVLVGVLASGWRQNPIFMDHSWVWLLLLLAAVAQAEFACKAVRRSGDPATVQRTIGVLIRGLILLQAFMTALAPWPGQVFAAGLVLAFFASRSLGKRFHAS